MDQLVSFVVSYMQYLVTLITFVRVFCLIWCQYIEHLVSLIVSYLQHLISVMVEMNETSDLTRGVSDNALGLTNVFNKQRF